jgi:hypothetical protein
MKTNMQFKSLMVLIALCALFSAFAPLPGAHSFQVYLDDKVVADQYIDRTRTAPKITIDPAENHKQLVVKYNECNRTVSGRVLTIKDTDDKVLKELKFDGTSKGFENPMSCNVRDLVALKPKTGNTLKLYYASVDFPEGQHVATLVIGPGTNTASN